MLHSPTHPPAPALYTTFEAQMCRVQAVHASNGSRTQSQACKLHTKRSLLGMHLPRRDSTETVCCTSAQSGKCSGTTHCQRLHDRDLHGRILLSLQNGADPRHAFGKPAVCGACCVLSVHQSRQSLMRCRGLRCRQLTHTRPARYEHGTQARLSWVSYLF
jgi:hypothetical protein